jgi:hypothetical protein
MFGCGGVVVKDLNELGAGSILLIIPATLHHLHHFFLAYRVDCNRARFDVVSSIANQVASAFSPKVVGNVVQ